MSNYRIDGSEMNEFKRLLEEIHTDMQAIQQQCHHVCDAIEQSSDWTGETRDAEKIYLSIITEYMDNLVNGPLADGQNAMSQIENKVDSFYAGCAAYQQLESL